MSNFLKKTRDSLIHSLLVSHLSWTIHSHCSFLVSDLSDLLTSLIKKEGMSEWLILKNLKKNIPKNMILFQLFWENCSFLVSQRANDRFAKKNKQFPHLSWATWANCSQLLIFHERPERFAHSHSFVLNDLSELLRVAHLIWAIWANEQMSKWAMREWGNSQTLTY